MGSISDIGAIWVDRDATLKMEASTLAGNTAAKGGGFYTGGQVQVANSTIAQNFAEGFGGGFLSFAGSVTLDHSTIVGNHALLNSGGFRNEGAQVSMSNSVISKNTSSVDADYSQDLTFPDGQVTIDPFSFVAAKPLSTKNSPSISWVGMNSVKINILRLASPSFCIKS